MELGQKFLQGDVSTSLKDGLDVGAFANVNPWYAQAAVNNPQYLDVKDSLNFGLAAKLANNGNQFGGQVQSNAEGVGKVSADAMFNVGKNTNLKAFYEKNFGSTYSNPEKYGVNVEYKF